ncbi:hypothetical protein E2C01_056372 [Portunus trituberculatus]|uniref:Uncharacterized protein n=1 Tax=Portunus trituberculatus TaxID=210409 RepID=A0A5B7GXJ7_PORTR|nr:hypothetical protein [Portunus trituberculatus]
MNVIEWLGDVTVFDGHVQFGVEVMWLKMVQRSQILYMMLQGMNWLFHPGLRVKISWLSLMASTGQSPTIEEEV